MSISAPISRAAVRGRWRGRLAAVAATGALVAAGLLVPTAAYAAFPGGNGKIYYIDPSYNVFSVNPDGSDATQLTTDGNDTIAVINPAGTKVAYLDYDNTSGTEQVYTMNPDGTDQTEITTAATDPDGANDGILSWSPDGTKLVYEPGITLTVINADGTDPVSLGAYDVAAVAWSPDGSKIAYTTNDDGTDNGALYTVNPDGTGQALLAVASSGDNVAPGLSWSPAGTELAFAASPSGHGSGNSQIVTVHADGTDQTILADSTDDQSPVWSPDGTKIAFAAYTASGFALETMSPDGSGKAPVGTITGEPTDWASIPSLQPAVTGLSPGSGPLAGGTTVTITGTGLTGATAVSFGTAAATSFTVNSATSITATSPAATTAGPAGVTVTTPAGTSTTSTAGQFSYTYAFTGFTSPVDNPPVLNQVNAGQAIPMKWSLGGNQGLNIIASGYPTATQVNCSTSAPVNTSTLTDTAGGSGLQYDAGSGTYTYVWKTAKAYSGTCQQFTLTLTDGTTHTADFQFK